MVFEEGCEGFWLANLGEFFYNYCVGEIFFFFRFVLVVFFLVNTCNYI